MLFFFFTVFIVTVQQSLWVKARQSSHLKVSTLPKVEKENLQVLYMKSSWLVRLEINNIPLSWISQGIPVPLYQPIRGIERNRIPFSDKSNKALKRLQNGQTFLELVLSKFNIRNIKVKEQADVSTVNVGFYNEFHQTSCLFNYTSLFSFSPSCLP